MTRKSRIHDTIAQLIFIHSEGHIQLQVTKFGKREIFRIVLVHEVV